MTQIVALIHGAAGEFGISFPDFPGVASGGDSLSMALERGSEALRAHIATLHAEGMAIPTIRSLAEIEADEAFAEDVRSAGVVALAEFDVADDTAGRPAASTDVEGDA